MANPTQAQIDKLTTNLSRYDSIINGAYNETVTLDSHTVKSISGYLAELPVNTLRGSWATATAYAIKDIVEESGNWYVCLEAHTSGTFSSDLTADKWALYQINLSGNLDLNGDLNVSGTVDATTLTVSDGSTSAPSITDTGDTNTGIYFPSADTLGIVTGGVERLRWDSSGKMAIGSTVINSTYSPIVQINSTENDNSGGLLISSYKPSLSFVDISGGTPAVHQITSDNGTLSFVVDSNQDGTFNLNAMSIDPTGNVGVGTSSPDFPLQVVGSEQTGVSSSIANIVIPDTVGNRGSYSISNGSGGLIGGIAGQIVTAGTYPNSVGKIDIFVQNGGGTTTVITANSSGKVFMPSLATSGTDNGTLKYNSSTGEIWVD